MVVKSALAAAPSKRAPAPTSPAADIWVLRQDAGNSNSAGMNGSAISAPRKGGGGDDDDVPVTGVVIARPHPHRHCITVNPQPPMVGRD